MYYDTLQEAIDAEPDCTHVLTTGTKWSGDKEFKGKFNPAHKSRCGYYDSQGSVYCMGDDCWIVAWARGEKMSRTEAAYKCMELNTLSFLEQRFSCAELEEYRELVNDGYTLWLDGGECPVDEGVLVDAVWRNGRHLRGGYAGVSWGFTLWKHMSAASDIIAYRVVGAETKDCGTFEKVDHYTDKTGTDLIDDFARHRTPEQFRGAMMFLIEKYMRRCGKKDDIEDEVYKIADYANRWLEYEKKLK